MYSSAGQGLAPLRHQPRPRPETTDALRLQKASVESEHMYATQNNLNGEVRSVMVGLLNACLIDAVDLSLQAHVAHWNVNGPQFIPLHQLFDQIYEQTSAWVDLLAERAVQLGGLAEANLANVAERTHLPAYNPRMTAGNEHLYTLSVSLSVFGKNVRAAIDTALKADDFVTADLITQIARGSDKLLWMVEAQFQAAS
ncbi:MAG TPA: DNA starvation/stationary phase protection protein Dps [Planctomycetota bacterium]|nr:DNA starvation/stationary phase protection protein Dps [Planctomycetota bacterium]